MHSKSTQPNLITSNFISNMDVLLELAPVAILTTNQMGQIIFANVKIEEMFGYQRAELINQLVEKLLPQQFHQIHEEYRAQYIKQPQVRTMGHNLDLVAQRKDGSIFPVEVALSFIQTPQEIFVQAVVVDITIRKQEKEILEQHVQVRTHEIEQRRRVADTLRDLLILLNANDSLPDVLRYIVSQAVKLFQAQACVVYQLLENKLSLVMQANYGLSTKQSNKAKTPFKLNNYVNLSSQPIVITETIKSTKPHALTPLLKDYQATLAVPLIIKDGLYGHLVFYYREARLFSGEEINLARTFGNQAALAIENARLRAQVEQAAVTAERNRLARDLHDSVTQTLFSASVIAEVLPKLWHRNQAEGERRLEELRQLTRDALAEMRTLLLELRPLTLTEVALGDLLRQLTEAIMGRIRVPIALDIQGECALRPEIQVALYRIAQEALNNVAKHAVATEIKVTLHCQFNQVKLSIADNGSGFDLKQVRHDSLGLNIMRERAEKIGAILNLRTKPEHGTEITVTLEL